MKRLITKNLISWQNQMNRKPLIIRGARQVGKSWSIIDFGKSGFSGQVHVVDLEKHPDWHRVFEPNLDAKRILEELEILLNTRIVPGNDLLFFDEIQECPQALMALRYFYEQVPGLHIIAAGSLLEFALQDISFPVGRVQMMNMYPMNFAEFLWATNQPMLAEIILNQAKPQPEAIHTRLIEELRKYFFIGGMPECVKTYVDSGSITAVFEIQADLIHAFRQDFSKYAPYSDKRCLNNVLTAVATKVGQQTKYAHLAEGFSNPTIKKSYDLLCSARVFYKISAASGSGLPFGATASEKKFKTLVIDIGLMRYLNKLPPDVQEVSDNLLSLYRGSMAEQFVGQELLSAGQDLYYWSREAKSSIAEVDYLIDKNRKIYPIEVKSGPSGKLRSLHLFLTTYSDCLNGYVLSGANYASLPEQKLEFMPLYYAYSLRT
ncbi:MAG: AAA family ATPase [Bacteroidales bacterium]